MRIAVLPIDSRPCNTQFVHRLVTWAGGECVLPSPDAMDNFRRPASYAESRRFLEQQLARCDAAVVSLDHWCFGSLLASREDQVTTEEALSRTAELKAILRAHPDVPVYMSTIVMRSSVSALSRNDLETFRAMTDYSVSSDRFEQFALPEDRERAENARLRLPPAILEKVLRVRKRNLQVSLAAVDLAAAGDVRSLSILQEDSQVYGLHRKDQRVLLQRIRETGVNNAYLRNGADEAGALSAARAMWADRPPLGVQILYLGQAGFTAPYEDRPFRENLESACREIGIAPSGNSPVVICVCCPPDGEQEEAGSPVSPAYLKACAQCLDKLLEEGKQVYLLDIIRANGGTAALVSGMQHADLLSGYSAWNTASNSMGTLLAQVLTDALHGSSNRQYFQERLLDDLVYQETIRPELQSMLSAMGEDVLSLKNKEQAEEMLRSLYQKELPALWPLRQLPRYAVSLPWPRTFEVKAEAFPTGGI